MPACPNCTCTDAVSNKIPSVPFYQVAQQAVVLRNSGQASDGVGNLVAWVGVSAANHFRRDLRCSNCGFTYNG